MLLETPTREHNADHSWPREGSASQIGARDVLQGILGPDTFRLVVSSNRSPSLPSSQGTVPPPADRALAEASINVSGK